MVEEYVIRILFHTLKDPGRHIIDSTMRKKTIEINNIFKQYFVQGKCDPR